MEIIGDVFFLIGGFFLFMGSLGLVRMPDVFNRIQAGAKSATLGSLGLIIGTFFYHPGWWAKLAVIALFVLVTSPVGSSTIARAALSMGITPWAGRSAKGESE